VLTASSSFTFTEKDNVASYDYGRGQLGRRIIRFVITVPRNTGDRHRQRLGARCPRDDVSGDVKSEPHGDVVLEGLGGGALVETMNGEINASFTQQLPPAAAVVSSMTARSPSACPTMRKPRAVAPRTAPSHRLR